METLGLIALARGNLSEARTHLDSTLQASQSIGDRVSIRSALVLLALVAAEQHDHRAAAVFLREGADLARELGDATTVTWGRCWTALAATLAARGSPERGLRLLAAAERVR